LRTLPRIPCSHAPPGALVGEAGELLRQIARAVPRGAGAECEPHRSETGSGTIEPWRIWTSCGAPYRHLRDPDRGRPWDREQTFASIAPYTIEEAYEVDDAIRREAWSELCDELGDLLLQVVYHAQMAEEAGQFGLDDVIVAICAKLVRRHPHVFSGAPVDSAAAVARTWEAIKAREHSGGPFATRLTGAAGSRDEPVTRARGPAPGPVSGRALRAARPQCRAERAHGPCTRLQS